MRGFHTSSASDHLLALTAPVVFVSDMMIAEYVSH